MNEPEIQKLRVGIVGHGFVGKAVEFSFTSPFVEFFLVDPNYGTTIDDLVAWSPQLSFICVPTPALEDGGCDCAAVHDAVLKLTSHTQGGITIKSTMPPDQADLLMNSLNPQHYDRVVFHPEFLTERNSFEQHVHPNSIVLGGMPPACDSLMNAYARFSNIDLSNCSVHMMSPAEACFTKYAVNSFLALKVTFFNQLYDSTLDTFLNFNTIIKAVGADPRITMSHTRVPGYDNKRGFGGACFPKDVQAFSKWSPSITLLDTVKEINDEYRREYNLDEREAINNIDFGIDD